MAEKIAILVDSGSDLPEELTTKYSIMTMNLRIVYGNEVFEDGKDISPQMVYERFPQQIPKTSTPNLLEVKDAVEQIRQKGYRKLIAVCISSGLSGTYNTVKTALGEFTDMETFVFDSRNISIGTGMFALWAARAVQDGMAFADITNGLLQRRQRCKIYFYMDTLEYLRAGGRIGKITGIIGKVLGIRPIISCNEEGVYYTVSMLRGRASGVRRLLEIAKKNEPAGKSWIALMNGDAEEQAQNVRLELAELFPDSKLIVDKQIVASLAVHTGPGLIGICMFPCD
ncbi:MULTISPECIES: DegV family protein [Caproicibacterium]|uniref:DegV family protein n=1 Tax=Caproicibacterium argilliputei TaxID=3030016 RepID=A0AA97H427_9FIRM|nr:DegV family protein [Caproicibacterium argilliputei]WOC32943.1 DegV family protein [Caproicibacterium argilliputei]